MTWSKFLTLTLFLIGFLSISLHAQSKWALVPHRQNYFLPFTYNPHPKETPAKIKDPNAELDKFEIKFKLSFKMMVAKKLLWGRGDLFIAYSQVSFWQTYNSKQSAPFRETNYEPEIFLTFDSNTNILGLNISSVDFSLNHESNGRGFDELTRSWNRVYANFNLERGGFYMKVRPWYRIPESKQNDDNPNIEKYMGYGDLTFIYKNRDHVISALIRNNLNFDENKGAIEIGWSFPLVQQLRGFIQFFNGYAENLLDYNRPNERIGIGIMIADWI